MKTGWPAAILAAAAGLVVLGATTAAWLVEDTTAEVGGVAVTQVTTVTGAQLRPGLMLVGLMFVLAALAVGLLKGSLRRLVGVALVVAGAGGVALGIAGLLGARDLPGTLQPAPWWALTGSVLGAASGWLALRRPDRWASLPARFDLDADDAVDGAQQGEPAPAPGAGAHRQPDPTGEWDWAVDLHADDRRADDEAR